MKYKLKKISGDASFRQFYRLKKNNKTSIIVSAKKEKFKNLAVYVVINNILNCVLCYKSSGILMYFNLVFHPAGAPNSA